MITEMEIWRSTHLMVKHYGRDAPTRAAETADMLGECGGADGQAVWLRIMQVCEKLLHKRMPDEPLN